MHAAHALLEELPRDARCVLHQIDLPGERALLVRMTREELRAVAFLDERALNAKRDGAWIALDELWRRSAPCRGAAPHAIFHIGHCGSTLVSRLLDAWPEALGLREPLPLRDLAEWREELTRPWARMSAPQWQDAFDSVLGLLARGTGTARTAIVKATSNCNALAEPWLRAHAATRALCLHIPLREYLATILKSAPARADCARFGPARLAALHAMMGDDSLRWHALDTGPRIALNWLAEMARLAQVARSFPAQAMRVDFAAFLREPNAGLGAIARHFGLTVDAGQVAAALAAPTAQRYAKATDHAYDAAARAADLAESTRRHGAEIDAGMAWVEAQLARYASLGELAHTLR
jgi:hypothetical protein